MSNTWDVPLFSLTEQGLLAFYLYFIYTKVYKVFIAGKKDSLKPKKETHALLRQMLNRNPDIK